MGRLQTTAEQLERMPNELIEPILAQLRLKDLIELWRYAGIRLRNAINDNGEWQPLWPHDPDEVSRLEQLYFEVVKEHYRIFAVAKERIGRNQGSRNWIFDPLDLDAKELVRDAKRSGASGVLLAKISEWVLWLVKTTRGWQELDAYSQGENPRALVRSLQITPKTETFLKFFTCECFLSTRETSANRALLEGYDRAQACLNVAKSNKILKLAELYAAYPGKLKTPLGPQSQRPNSGHISHQLHLRSQRLLRCINIGSISRTRAYSQSLFCFAHACLVPYDWCLALWLEVLQACPALLDEPHVLDFGSVVEAKIGSNAAAEIPRPPPEIQKCMQITNMGMLYCYQKCSVEGCDGESPADVESSSLKRFQYCAHFGMPSTPEAAVTKRIQYAGDGSIPSFYIDTACRIRLGPSDPREIEWLTAFIQAVSWMELAFPNIAGKIMDDYHQQTSKVEAAEKVKREERVQAKKAKSKKRNI
ncbi:hypothetical protein BX600DRAFT_438791 [Xylariales sp. PMI_506]|nr:hypothetical protein BX600DRAFT_438791 [Xylariales sp. PMI_506]